MQKLGTASRVPLVGAARLVLALAVLAVCYGAFAPPSAAPSLLPWDKAEHFAAFFVLTVLCLVAFPKTRVLWLALALSAFGGAIELIQGLSFIGRDSEAGDWAADTLAVAAALTVLAAARLRASAAGELRRTLLKEG
jgi:VanZ family protein